MNNEQRFLRLPEVLKLYPVGRSTLYAKIQNGEFPKPYSLGARTSAWDAQEVNDFLLSLKERGKNNV